jgi:RNA polymerase sigma factor (sigma-70 family)
MITPEVVTEFNLSSDGELIIACQNGKEAAWDALVVRYEQLVYTLMDRCNVEKSEEGEMFQSVWSSFFKNLDSLGRTKRVAAWLVAATQNELRRRLYIDKFKNGHGSDTSNEEWDASDPEDFSPADILSRYGQYEVTCRAIMKLDARSQQLLTMLYGEPTVPSYEEVAAKLGVPVDSVEKLRVSSLKKLRQTITDFT